MSALPNEVPERHYATEKLSEAKAAILRGIHTMLVLRAKVEQLRAADLPKAQNAYTELAAVRTKLVQAIGTARLALLELDMEGGAQLAAKLSTGLGSFNLMSTAYKPVYEAINGFAEKLPDSANQKVSAAVIGRLMNHVKMGYYPTDPDNMAHILRGLQFPTGVTTNLLDPCCGCGKALRQLAQGNNCYAYGMELDEFRAEEAQSRLHRVGVGSFFHSRISNEAFHAISNTVETTALRYADTFTVAAAEQIKGVTLKNEDTGATLDSSVTLAPGELLGLGYEEILNDNATLAPLVQLHSSDPSVISITNGVLQAKGSGTAVVTATICPDVNGYSYGDSTQMSWTDHTNLLPSSLLKTQTLTVTVRSSGGGASASSSRPDASVDGEGGKITTGNGTVTITPDKGYQVSKISVNGKEVDIPADGKLTGLKSTDRVVVTFEKIPTVDMGKFTDLDKDAWYYTAAEYAVQNGLFTGTSETTFSPSTPMSRAMLVTALYRAAGMPSIEDGILGYPFADVDAESWYGSAVYWARLKGITSGTGEETFSPEGNITREQLAVMLYRYAGSPATNGALDGFTDAGTAGSYAITALHWAVEQGILTGKGGGILDPKGNATRAEVATVLVRFAEKLGGQKDA